jgi:hypothetical protein
MDSSILGYFVIPVLAFVIYGPCLRGAFVFDDISGILGRKPILRGDWKGSFNAYWRSIPTITYAAEIQIWNPMTIKSEGQVPPDSFSFHIFNVIIHILNSFAVAWILLGLDRGPHLSMLGALIFISLPLATSATAYISARPSLLSALFGFLAIGSVLNGVGLLAFPFLALAVMSKEDTAILPVTTGIVAYISGSVLWPLFGLLPLIFLIRHRKVIPDLFKHNGNEAMGKAGMETAFSQPVHALTTFTEYVLRFPCWMFGGLQNPDPLIHPTRIRSLRFLTALGLFLNVIALAVLWEPMRLPLLFMVVAPHAVYALIPLPDQVFEHRFYFSCLGITLLFTTWAEMLPVWGLTLAIASLASMAAFRASFWNNWLDFWLWPIHSGSAYKARPLQNVSALYKLNQRPQEARKFLQVAVSVNPNSGSSLCDLADLDALAGNLTGAERWLERSIRDCPQFSQGWEYMANLQTHLGNKERAAACQDKIAALAAGG